VVVTRTLAELVLLVALLLAAWLIAVNNSFVAPPAATRPPGGTAYHDRPADAGLPEHAEALRAYLASPRPLAPVRRNPFGFQGSSRAADEVDGRRSAAGGAATISASSRPAMELEGIAEETGNGHPQRTAVIAVEGELIFAKEGDRVLSRFLVVRITEDAVQLKDDEGGGTFSLVLK
jgi:hypothetical protein